MTALSSDFCAHDGVDSEEELFRCALVEEPLIVDQGSHVIYWADSVRPNHLSDRTFDHDYYFELPG
jgi:hypothetical protein